MAAPRFALATLALVAFLAGGGIELLRDWNLVAPPMLSCSTTHDPPFLTCRLLSD